MIEGYKARQLNKELKELAARFENEYAASVKTSENRYKQTLEPGQTFHAKNGFYDDETRHHFEQTCQNYRAKAHEILDGAAAEIMAESVKAPSTEAVNAVAMIAGRKNISADELDILMTEYGQDCPLVYKRLQEIAEDHGYHNFRNHPVGEQAESVQILADSIDRTFNAINVENRSIVATMAGFDANIDQAFPAAE